MIKRMEHKKEASAVSQKKLSVTLKAVIAGIGVCALIVYLLILPNIGETLHASYPEFAAWHWPWMIFLWATAAPVCAALFLCWRVAGYIGEGRSFSLENARLLQIIARLTGGTTVYFFLGNAVLMLLSMNHPGVLLISLLICFAGAAVTVAAACLSHLARKAADLQEQSDLTV